MAERQRLADCINGIIMISRFSFPTRIVFGPGAVRELGNEAGSWELRGRSW